MALQGVVAKTVHRHRACVAGLAAVLVLMLSAAAVRAEVVTTLYHAEVLVASQGETARREAASKGLAEIVVRVSGVPAAVEPGCQESSESGRRDVSS